MSRAEQNTSDRDDLEQIVAAILEADDIEAAVEEACAEHTADAARIRSTIEELRRLGILAAPERQAAAPTDTVGGYRLLATLGRGGMGVVYRAIDPDLGREVALKVLRPELLHFDESRQRFRREIDVVARLQHPGIVSVLGAGEDGGVPFFTMELVDGDSLASTIAALRSRPLSSLRGAHLFDSRGDRGGASSSESRRLAEGWVDACLQICRSVAEALQHAHERGVYHRDVKPSNILIDRHGRARLLDFGLARLESAQDLTRSTAMLGSLPYMPPGRIGGGISNAGPQQDIYSLGVTLYELLTLQSPFLAATAEQTQQRVLAQDPPRPSSINPRIAKDVETVCLTAMDPDPRRRYASAQAFADELTRLLERKPVLAQPPGIALRARRFAQRHTTATVAGALGLLLAIASVVAAFSAQRAAANERETARIQREARERLVDSNIAFLAQFVDGLNRIPGSTALRSDLLGRVAGQLGEIEREITGDPRRLAAVCAVHLQLANVLGNPDLANVGKRGAAEQRFDHVSELAARLSPLDPLHGALLGARALRGKAEIARFGGKTGEAIALQRRAAELVTPHLSDAPSTNMERAIEDLYVNCQSKLASLAGSQGNHEEALRGFEAVRERNRLRAAQHPDDEQVQLNFARSTAISALARYMLGQHERAADDIGAFVELLDERLRRDPDDTGLLLERLIRGMQLTEILVKAERLDRAIALCDTDLECCARQIETDPSNARFPEIQVHLTYNKGWGYQRRAERALAKDGTMSEKAREDLRKARSSLQAALVGFRALKRRGAINQSAQEKRIRARITAVEKLLREG